MYSLRYEMQKYSVLYKNTKDIYTKKIIGIYKDFVNEKLFVEKLNLKYDLIYYDFLTIGDQEIFKHNLMRALKGMPDLLDRVFIKLMDLFELKFDCQKNNSLTEIEKEKFKKFPSNIKNDNLKNLVKKCPQIETYLKNIIKDFKFNGNRENSSNHFLINSAHRNQINREDFDQGISIINDIFDRLNSIIRILECFI